MGGWCAMVDGKMCVGIIKEALMARVGPDAYENALQLPHATVMDFTGRPMKGYVTVHPLGIDNQEDLEKWIGLCLTFNPQAKSSKKKA